MKKIFLFMVLFFTALCGCNSNIEKKKAERLVKLYLDSLNHDVKNYKIINYKDLHAIYTEIEDDPAYEKFKNNASKLDSIKKAYPPKIRSWVIYVKFKGKDNYGNFGEHIYQCGIDKNLSKFVVGIEVNNFP